MNLPGGRLRSPHSLLFAMTPLSAFAAGSGRAGGHHSGSQSPSYDSGSNSGHSGGCHKCTAQNARYRRSEDEPFTGCGIARIRRDTFSIG